MGAVLVCRPQPGADATVAALTAAGWKALPMPVLRREAIPEDAAMRTRVQALAEYAAIVFVSVGAVDFGLELVDRYWPELPVRPRWVAVGEATGQALARWGVQAEVPADERSEGMLELPALAGLRDDRVLVVRGQDGRGWLAQRLQERGVRVDFLEVYARVIQPLMWPSAETVAALVVTSVAVLEAVVASSGLRYRNLPIIVPSSRVAEAAQGAGFVRVEVAAGVTAPATLAALRRRC